jgi:hypothetical protein
VFVILCVVNAVIHKTCLPYFVRKRIFPLRAKGETTLDELQCLLQRYFRCRCQQQMEVIGHDHKVMQEKPSLSSILRKNIYQKLSHAIGLEKRATPVCRRGHEERYGVIGQLGAFTPGLKPRNGRIMRSRGFENPRPRTEVRGYTTDYTRTTQGPARGAWIGQHLTRIKGHSASRYGAENVETPDEFFLRKPDADHGLSRILRSRRLLWVGPVMNASPRAAKSG